MKSFFLPVVLILIFSTGAFSADFSVNHSDWTLKKHDGAEGRIEVISGGRNGKKCLRIIKTNALGFLQVVTADPIRITNGGKYIYRGYFHTADSGFDTFMLFRVTKTQDSYPFFYDDIDRSSGYPSQSLLCNSNKGQWRKRAISYRGVDNSEVFLNILITGNPITVDLDDIVLTTNEYSRTVPPGLEKRVDFPYTKDEVYKILEKRKPSEAFLQKNGSRMEMILNDKPIVPAFYKCEPYHSGYVFNRYTEFREAGVPLMVRSLFLSSAIGKPGVVKGPGEYDFELMEEVIMYALRQNPEANLVIEFFLNEPYPGWEKDYSDELWRNGAGKFAYGLWGNYEGFVSDLKEVKLTEAQKRESWKPWGLGSYSSPAFRRIHEQSITDITRHLMNSPIGKAIVGFHIGGGHDGQFQFFSTDYSKCSIKAFQDFLRRKYKNIETMNRICQTKIKSFDDVSVPRDYNKNILLANNLLADYNMFKRIVTCELKHNFANAARKAAGKRVFVSSYGEPTAFLAETFCSTPGGVDIHVVPGYYPFRPSGYPLGAKPQATFALHNKMWLMEVDQRSWTGQSQGEVYDMWLGSALTAAEFTSVNRKLLGICLANYSAYWYYTMFRYFDRPELMEEIKTTQTAAEKILNIPHNPFRPDVCLVETESSYDTLIKDMSVGRLSMNYPVPFQQFEISGVPYDRHTLKDVLEHPELQNYKMYVFWNTSVITTAERKKIEQLKKKGKLLVFCHSSGYLDENGINLKSMSDLVGFPVVAAQDKFERSPAIINSRHELSYFADPFISMGELMLCNFSLAGSNRFIQGYPLFRINRAADSEIMAYYKDGSIAAAIKKTENGSIAYFAPLFPLTAKVFHYLARQAKAYTTGEPGQSIAMNGNFISLHGIHSGIYAINLPDGVDCVEDAFTGKILAENTRTFSIEVTIGETKWFILRKSKK